MSEQVRQLWDRVYETDFKLDGTRVEWYLRAGNGSPRGQITLIVDTPIQAGTQVLECIETLNARGVAWALTVDSPQRKLGEPAARPPVVRFVGAFAIEDFDLMCEWVYSFDPDVDDARVGQ